MPVWRWSLIWSDPKMELIETDCKDTWPETILLAIKDHADEIDAYQLRRARIDRAAARCVALRIHRPENPYEPAWNKVLKACNEALAGRYLTGFHATRLTESEREEISSNGLRILSPALLADRLNGIADKVPNDVLDSLRTRNQACREYRAGKTWFCFTRALLLQEGGVGRFFRLWGGEALYQCHQNDTTTGRVLRELGKPCIVVARVPIAKILGTVSVGQRLVNAWCAKRGIKTADGADFEGCINADIPGRDIIHIVTLDDPEFRLLTRHDTWRNPLS